MRDKGDTKNYPNSLISCIRNKEFKWNRKIL
jgi:hypothetical protein